MPGAEQPLEGLSFVAFDLETTGLSASQDRIVEIGALRFGLKANSSQETWQVLINPGQSIPNEIQEIHGITNAMVQDAKPFAEMAPQFLSFIENSVLLAHNASFDLTFLACELQRLGLSWPQNLSLDTCRLARVFLPDAPNYKLSTLVDFLKLPSAGPAHRALPDAIACAGVFQACLQAAPLSTLQEVLDLCPQAHTSFSSPQMPNTNFSGLSIIFQAMQAQKPIEIIYHNGRNKKDRRQITPLFLGGHGEYAYLEAYCHLRQAHRQFRLGRIIALSD